MIRLVTVLLGVLVAAYPLIILFGLQRVPDYYLGIFFILLAGLRLWFLYRSGQAQLVTPVLCVVLILVVLYALFSGQPMWFRFYPVAVNTVLFGLFAFSLIKGPPLVERIARLTEPDLPVEGVSYTRKVTAVWTCFFVVNGLAALYTALWSSFEVWAWYNGALAYCLMGTLFAGEWLLRKKVRGNASV